MSEEQLYYNISVESLSLSIIKRYISGSKTLWVTLSICKRLGEIYYYYSSSSFQKPNANIFHLLGKYDMTYQGIVRMAINALVFAPDYSSCNYNIDTTKVNRLKHIFELEGCNRYDPQNFIRGSITRDALQKALVRSRLTLASLQREGDPPMLHLPPDTYVRCDQGRSRVKALLDTDRSFYWWTVELYAGKSKSVFFLKGR